MPTPREIEALTDEIEERKLEKERLREERKELKRKKQRAEKLEKMVAPFLLFLTVLIGALIWFL